jgi:hypothetical protein
MLQCTQCQGALRVGVRFCTHCGAPFSAPPIAPPPVSPPAASSPSPAAADEQAAPVPSTVLLETRPPRPRSTHRLPPERSTAAVWAFVTGLAPFATSVVGNLLTAQAGAQLASGLCSLGMVLGLLTLVFVVNAALLTVCGITGGRGIRETANGFTKGRGLAIAGLTLGSINLVLWLAGLIVSIMALAPFFN